jgi:superfamily II DNA or RNA helicase
VKIATIRRNGRLLDVSVDGKLPLSERAYEPLMADMTYEYKKLLHGRERYERGFDKPLNMRIEPRRLYHFDGRGRLVCGVGYLDRIYTKLRCAGFTVGIVDYTNYQPDAKFAPNWDKLNKHDLFTPRPGDARKLKKLIERGITPDASLARRVKQRELMEVAAKRIQRKLGGVYKLPPGYGKSFNFAAYALLFDKLKIAITAPDIDNVEKTVSHLGDFFPAVGQVGGGKKRFERVTVYTRDSIKYIQEDTDLLFIDEVHKYATDRVIETIVQFAPRAVINCYSATPYGRIDNAHRELEPLSGPCVYEMDWIEATQLGLIVPIEVRWLDCKCDPNPIEGQKDPHRRRRDGIWRNDARNKAFADVLHAHNDKDQKLIIVQFLEHALNLKKFLPDFEVCYAGVEFERMLKFEKLDLITDEFIPMDRDTRQQMRLDFEKGKLRRVIATDVWSTGVSFDALPVVARADARQTEILDEQIPGRVSRPHEESGKRFGILYDSNDSWDTGFHRGAGYRRNNYTERGWTQKSVKRCADLVL